MHTSEQPTHHGYAVNVKDYDLYGGHDPLTDDQAQMIYDSCVEDFWMMAQDVAKDHGFEGVWSEGRMGGYAKPYPQPAADDMWSEELDAWMETRFRPFERDILALMEDMRQQFTDDLTDAIEDAKREPMEAAYWAARDTITVD